MKWRKRRPDKARDRGPRKSTIRYAEEADRVQHRQGADDFVATVENLCIIRARDVLEKTSIQNKAVSISKLQRFVSVGLTNQTGQDFFTRLQQMATSTLRPVQITDSFVQDRDPEWPTPDPHPAAEEFRASVKLPSEPPI